jgi:hypothetical protein
MRSPRVVITDKHRAYPRAIREQIPQLRHRLLEHLGCRHLLHPSLFGGHRPLGVRSAADYYRRARFTGSNGQTPWQPRPRSRFTPG